MVLVENDENSVYKVTFQRHLFKISYIYAIVPINQTSGFYLCQYKKVDLTVGLNLLHCSRGGYTLSENICNGVKDWPNDRSDEENCLCHNTNKDTPATCKVKYIRGSKRICSSLYHMRFDGNCQLFMYLKSGTYNNNNNKTYNNYTNNTARSLSCKNKRNIHKLFIGDLIFDCGPEGEDEPVLMSLLINKTYSSCTQPHVIPCMEGHSKFYYL